MATTKTKTESFTAEEKAAMKERAEEIKREKRGAGEAEDAKAGAFVATSALQPTWESRTIRMEGGEVVRQTTPSGHVYFANEGGELKVHDGPYAETREQFGGYFIIDAPDMDAAIDWARKCPAVQWGSIEIRPYHPGYGA